MSKLFLRKEQAEKRRHFLEEIKLEKKIVVFQKKRASRN